MIQELTPEQAATLRVVCDEWLTHGLSTEPANRAAAEEGVRMAYSAVGLPAPQTFIWLGSPMAGCVSAAMMRPAGETGDDVLSRVRDQVLGNVLDHVLGSVGDQLGGNVRAQVRGRVLEPIWGAVMGRVGAEVRDEVRGRVGIPVREQVWQAIYGQHDAAWVGWIDAMGRIGVTGLEPAAGLLQVARVAGWWWPFTDTVILTERPTSLHLDSQGRLHNETGPAITYPDRWAIYARHGTRVPADLLDG